MTGTNEFKLNQAPDDGVSAVKFSPNTSQFLLVSSWDSTVRLYDVHANTMRLKYQHSGAVLDCAFHDPTHSWSGGLDLQLKSHDLNTDQESVVGCHEAPIRCVEYCPEVNVIVTGSWDQTVKLWDPRTPCNAGTFLQPEKVCAFRIKSITTPPNSHSVSKQENVTSPTPGLNNSGYETSMNVNISRNGIQDMENFHGQQNQ
ncbi:mitotic checkpoint protein BUB3-like [Protopterus annectens]|uniref:mitotic checkpoint protein BUB3-like n=1 Tax=Protopterus annectens TaxID=7888 RepID=UPI001CFB3A3E|nr:mitotic checkpoint protein BUB3-like [Protopterus annectens]